MEEQDNILEREIMGQGVFVGTFTHSLDPKKRLTIPSGWRAQLAEKNSLYVLPDVNERCLQVFPAAELMQRINRLRQHSMADRVAGQFARILASQADLVCWDVQGRIRIKDDLLNGAGLVDQVVLVGAFTKFELWSPESFKAVSEMDKGKMGEAALYVGM